MSIEPQNPPKASATVFYSWQSDVLAKTNRYLIEKALDRAVAEIRGDGTLAVEPRVDQATLDVPGSPEIAQTILTKIAGASAFVADVTIVNPGVARPTPNPNVLVELGYALRALGWERVVMVFNTANGKPDQLPFDLRGKRALTYHLPEEGSDKAEQRTKLQAALAAALRMVLAHTAAPPAPHGPTAAEQAVAAIKRGAANQSSLCTRFMRDIADRVSQLTPDPIGKNADQATEQLAVALHNTLPLVTEFTTVAIAIAEHNARPALLGLFRGFDRLFPLYNLPVGFSGRVHRGQFDLPIFLGHELLVTLVAALMGEQKWPLIGELCRESLTVPNGVGAQTEVVTFMYAARYPWLLHEGVNEGTEEFYRHTELLRARHGTGAIAEAIGWSLFQAADTFLLFRSILAPTDYDLLNSSTADRWLAWSTRSEFATPGFLHEARRRPRAEELASAFGLAGAEVLRQRLIERLRAISRTFGNRFRFPVFHDVDPAAIGTLD